MTGHGDGGWNRTYVPAINRLFYQPLHYPPSPWKVVPHHRGWRPLLFTNSSVGSFTPHENQNSCKTAGPTEFCPFPRRLECPTICRCYNKGSKFSSLILRPWVLVQPGFKPTTSRSADRQTKSRKSERRASKLTAFPRYRWHNQNGLVESLMVT